jgi:hypothetical protein
MSFPFELSANSKMIPHYTVTILKDLHTQSDNYPVYIHNFGLKSHVVNKLFNVKKLDLFDSEFYQGSSEGFINIMKIGTNFDKYLESFEVMMGNNIVSRESYYNRFEYTIHNLQALGEFKYNYPQQLVYVEVHNNTLILSNYGPISYEVEQIYNTLSERMTLVEKINPNRMYFVIDPNFFRINYVVIDVLSYLNNAGFEITNLFADEFCMELKQYQTPITPMQTMLTHLRHSDFNSGANNILKDYQPELKVKRNKSNLYDAIVF